MVTTNNCLVKARPHLSESAYRQVVDGARTLQEDQGLPEKAAIAQAAEAVLQQVSGQLEPKQSTARDVTQTEAFKKWFGDSKVVDADGKPLVVYHGTPSDFTSFDMEKSFDGGVHFGTMQAAEGRMKYWMDGNDGTGQPLIMPVYLSVKNPLTIEHDPGDEESWSELIEDAKSKGHDGIIYPNEVEREYADDFDSEGQSSTSYVAFRPEQIKSAIGNDGNFDPESADITRSTARSASRPIFYSQLQLAIEQVPERLSTMAAPQWKLWLDANASKLGVKREEIEWSGIKDYLAMRGKDKVTSQELSDYLRDNGVKVKDVVLGGSATAGLEAEVDDLFVKLDALGYSLDRDEIAYGHVYMTSRKGGRPLEYMPETDRMEDRDTGGTVKVAPAVLGIAERLQEIASEAGHSDGPNLDATRYSQYTVAGGQNYREVLITLPESDKDGRLAEVKKLLEDDSKLSDDELRSLLKEETELMKTPREGYRSSHWDAANVLAHIRVDDRTDADGRRVLFINEIQSDWAQQGRKEGFMKPVDQKIFGELRARLEDLLDQQHKVALELATNQGNDELLEKREDLAKQVDSLETEMRAEQNKANGLPRAPFVEDTKSWVSLALKRAIMMAAEGGYDKVAFVTGAQAADLFDLSKQISKVRYEDNSAGGVGLAEMSGAPSHGRLMAWDLDGKEVLNQFVQTPTKDLPDMIGKEAAEKLLNQPGKNERTGGGNFARVKELSGLDLKIGGEGMHGFYDNIVPQVANDILKKIGGGKVGEVEIGTKTGDDDSFEVVLPNGKVVATRGTRASAEATAKSFDGATVREISFSQAQPGFEITPAMRDALEDGIPLFSTARAARDMDVGFGYKVADFLDSSKKVSWWDKTVGTPYHLAQKHPTFGRVYNSIQSFISDVSKYATRAADLAPSILPKLEDMKDIFKSPMSAADVQALSDPIFKGTLIYTRNAEGDPVEAEDVGSAGIVWTDKELKSMWNLDERQIGLYREFRKATNKSIADLAVTNMVRYAGQDAEGVRGRVLAATTVQQASELLADHLAFLAGSDSKRANTLMNAARSINDMADEARGLMARGYAPLSRYGDFTVYAPSLGENGYFEMFETERDANRRARDLRAESPDLKITVGTMSKEASKLFKGITPETLALFGDALGLEESASDRESQVFQEYLKLAKSTRSAMKRLIHRKGVAGYSNDVGRVLASFVYSNARQAAQNLNAGEILRSANEVPEGDLKDHAIRLVEYAQAPQEEMQGLRGLVFAQFIGGNIASALVNTTQSVTTTWPTLTQYFGAGKSAKAMVDALGVIKSGPGDDADLKAAMERAAVDGITDPNETHQLQGQAQGRGSLKAGDGTPVGDTLAKLGNGLEKLKFVWGKGFGLAEVLNRKIAFISAYKLARDKGEKNPYEFARKIVNDSQFVMNKGANPVWARGPVGATLFQFKKFSVFYLENLARMWGNGPEGKKAFAMSLAIMFLMAGVGGFPFADDLDDVIDGFAQRVLNKSFSSKLEKKQFFASILGDAGANFVLSGISGLPGAPIDVSGRLGLGNLIPATGLLVKKANYGQDVQEIFGAAGTQAGRLLQAAGAASEGNVGGVIDGIVPVAVANALKAMDMIEMGQYRDQKGRKVIDTTLSEALLKGIGFQPASVKNVQDAVRTQQELIGLNKARETEIADLWAKGRIERKPELVEDAKRQMKEWNAANPTSPITIDNGQINKRVQQANMTKAQRLAATAPKEIRAGVKEALQRDTAQ